MGYLILCRNVLVSRNIYRRISTELWDTPLTQEKKKQIEEYWSKKLTYINQFDRKNLDNKYYLLSMFPYPSGKLHIGHVRVYTIGDVVARFFRLNGKNVFQPMGWDAFGLPAENAAIERDIAPQKWTDENTKHMDQQLKSLLCTFDWNAGFSTCDPKYYRWTQYIFLKIFESGLAYRKEAVVHWDPIDETVLADEQIDEHGKSWRSGAIAEKKLLKQWFIRTTAFAKDLFDALDEEKLDDWSDIIDIQKHWIGECDGISFDLKLTSLSAENDEMFLNVWVSDPKLIINAEFIAVKSTNHVFMQFGFTKNSEGKLNIEAVNPFIGSNLPIYIAEDLPYPLFRDVYLGVPSKSEIDAGFAQRVNLKRRETTILCDTDRICEIALNQKIGGYPVSSKLKDWLISRQRYWGTPIPIIYCDTCGIQPVPYDQLPVCLPPLPENHKIDKSLNTYLKSSGWVNTTCPKCGGVAERETDTMDTFVDSSWYYLRYIDPDNDTEPFDKNLVDKIMPVDLYVGGKEHAALHLYYARFIHRFLHSIGMVKNKEPFKKLLCQGMVKGKTYKTKEGKYLKPDEVFVTGEFAYSKETAENVDVIYEKMSKSKFNGIDPKTLINEHGVDTVRMLLLNRASPRLHFEWHEKALEETMLYQHRLWLTLREFLKVRSQPVTGKSIYSKEELEVYLKRERNRCIGGATYHFRDSHDTSGALNYLEELNACLRSEKTATREVRKYSTVYEKSLAALIIMLSPVVPHLASTLWFGFTSAPGRLDECSNEINWDGTVMEQKWPQIDGDFDVPIYFKSKNCPTFSVSTTNSLLDTLTIDEAIKIGEKDEIIKWWLDSKPQQLHMKKIENCGVEVKVVLRVEKKLEFLKKLKELRNNKKKRKMTRVAF